MQHLFIVANCGSNYCGVGKHAGLVINELRKRGDVVDLIDKKTYYKTGIRSWFSFSMFSAYIKAIIFVTCRKYDFVTIEYPFKENNPLFLLLHVFLFTISRLKFTKVALSMHEYDRLHILRKRVVDVLLYFSDLIFVSEHKYFTTLSKYRERMFIRIIPNQIPCLKGKKELDCTDYCYFGLVNGSKAFGEMIYAWKSFHTDDAKSKLHVISSSDLSNFDLADDSIVLHRNLSNAEVARLMHKCAFSLLPVKPNVSLLNTSFMAAIQSGCVPIGKFSEEIKDKDFVINVNSYDLDDFQSGLIKSRQLEYDDFKAMSNDCIAFGRQFTVENSVGQMVKAYIEILN